MGRMNAEEWKRYTSQYWYGQSKEVQAAHPKRIGGDILEAKPNGLFRGNECLADEHYLDWNWTTRTACRPGRERQLCRPRSPDLQVRVRALFR